MHRECDHNGFKNLTKNSNLNPIKPLKDINKSE